MSIPTRAYDLLRGYVHREWDRIQIVDTSSASKELSDSLSGPRMEPRSVDASRVLQSGQPFDAKAKACAVLGVDQDADFPIIRKAFERLNRRSDPDNFPSGTPEAYQAGQIKRRVQEAYRVLTAGMDGTEVRFGSLEIE